MAFGIQQLRIMELISRKTEVSIKEIQDYLRLGNSIAYTHIDILLKKGFVEKSGQKNKRRFKIASNQFARSLSNLLTDDSTITEVLANKGIPILMELISEDNLSIKQLAKSAGLSKPSIYPYIRNFVKRQMIKKNKGVLTFNKELWGGLYKFISEYQYYYSLSKFNQVPSNAKIYFESPAEIIFSLKTEVDFALKTAFSVYDKFGIRLVDNEIFYRLDNLSNKKLDIKTIFLDSLKIAKDSSRRRLYCYLFYQKNITYLRKVKHPDLEILKEIIGGKIEKAEGFPRRTEIIEKGEDYDIQI